MPKEIDVEATLENCRAKSNQCRAVCKKALRRSLIGYRASFFYLERAASALKRSVSRSRESEETKIAPNYH
jgi:hypothetical protein